MSPGERRRVLLFSVVVALIFGFLIGWFARILAVPSPESRARDVAERIRERVRDVTH